MSVISFHRISRYAGFVLLLSALQHEAPSQQGTAMGTVTGHVYCSDREVPARLARVVLFPLRNRIVQSPQQDSDSVPFVVAQTKSDGSFAIPRIASGDYYLSVEFPGYITPEWKFSQTELRNPTTEQRKKIMESVPTVRVVADRTASVDVSLQRGGSITGTLRYDDGSPAPNVLVYARRRDSESGWSEVGNYRSTTDDLGQYRISGLPPDEYTLVAIVAPQDASGNYSGQQLTIYYGDNFLSRDAKSIKLGLGETSWNTDITIKMDRIHSISGTLLGASGPIINGADIAIYTATGNVKVTETSLEGEDSLFRLNFVPEGHYILRVTNARSITRHTIQAPPEFAAPPVIKETYIAVYEPYSAPILVLGDISGLVINIQQKNK